MSATSLTARLLPPRFRDLTCVMILDHLGDDRQAAAAGPGRTSTIAHPSVFLSSVIHQDEQRHFASSSADLLLLLRPAVKPHDAKHVYSANTLWSDLSVLLGDVCILKTR